MANQPLVSQLAGEAGDLLAMPDVYFRLRELIDSDSATMDQVAQVLALDPGIVARLLRIANSAFYAYPSRVETVSRALTLLGTQQVHDLVLASSIANWGDGLHNELVDMETFWFRSVHCGFVARALGVGAGLRNGESLFVRGLLHDVGHLLLYTRYPRECRQALAGAEQGFAAVFRVQGELIGCNAGELTAAVMREWHLPARFVATMDWLHDPNHAPEHGREIAIMSIAAQLSHVIDTDLLLSDLLAGIPDPVWQLAELPREAGAAAVDDVSVEMVETMYRVLTNAA